MSRKGIYKYLLVLVSTFEEFVAIFTQQHSAIVKLAVVTKFSQNKYFDSNMLYPSKQQKQKPHKQNFLI